MLLVFDIWGQKMNIQSAAEPAHEANFRATIDRELVHRWAVSEVFPTAVAKASSTEFTVSAQWPRWHVFYGGRNCRFDSALVVETLRQLTVLIAHTHLAVPLDSPFLMPQIGIAMMAGRRRDATRPANVTVEVQLRDLRVTPNGVAAFRTAARFLVGGEEIARGDAKARIVDPRTYIRYRKRSASGAAEHHVPPVPAAAVGHLSDWNVVVGQSSKTRMWPLLVDTTNPILFDHPLDHIPGVLLIEAVRQVLRLEMNDPGLDFERFEAHFLSVAELGSKHDVVLESLNEGPEGIIATAGVHSVGTVQMRAVACVRPRGHRSGTPAQPKLPDPGPSPHG
ncbi:ScbA/BarX family gamma-butyrolactone biosynthesis protein [Paenarthrobacter nicotinovorans]|jgi:2-oxo-3-(phosphooxy)propyl 3-oxoalkanoate synthase|uniref:ScbA/BarX family gamma-butyrolactone biosynthesis protein n=1 Tax=Paenarthrobacter nicotinovorans TaxID=29320 RepID=UPI00382B8EBB